MDFSWTWKEKRKNASEEFTCHNKQTRKKKQVKYAKSNVWFPNLLTKDKRNRYGDGLNNKFIVEGRTANSVTTMLPAK